MKINVGKIDPFSSLEYPGEPAAVIYLAGCNFKCPWCWTYDILDPMQGEEREAQDVIREIEKEPGDIEAVVIDGGEPTQQPEALKYLCKILESEGYKVQINTNGSNPEVIDELGIRDQIDRLGLDVKAPLEFQRRYSKIIGREVNEEHLEGIREILRGSSMCSYEIEPRTTVVPDLIDSPHRIKNIAGEISMYTDRYLLQAFTPEKGTLDPEFEEKDRVTREELIKLGKKAQKYIDKVKIRTPSTGEETLSR